MRKKAPSIKGLKAKLIGMLLLVAMFGGWRPAQVYAQSAVTFRNLVFFTGTNGVDPFSALLQGNDGNLYGTTGSGGTSGGNGTFFRVTTNGVLTSLFSFNGTNGSGPRGNLVQGGDGAFYGTTADGGSNDVGTVFKITTNGCHTTLFEFNSTNGAYPIGGLALGNDGAFYGTTAGGGTNAGAYNGGAGTIFSVTTNGTFTSLFSFSNTNGNQPIAPLILGSDGSFYSTTFGGGATFSSNSAGNGIVFKFTPDGNLITLFSFPSNGGAPYAGLVQGSDGAFYGTTPGGGSTGNGTIFKITSDGMLTTLVEFDGTNGSQPFGGLIQARDGAFYGMAGDGGTGGIGFGSGDGTIYRLTTNGNFSIMFEFTDTSGFYPMCSLIQGSGGNFYGTTTMRGLYDANPFGAVFSFSISPVISALVQEGGNVLVLSWASFPGRSYQMQCKSSLTQSNWVNFGSPVTATDTTMTLSDTIASGVGQKLYRVALLP